MKILFKIARYTIADQLRHKSFYVILALSIGFIFMLRGCYSADYVINGRQVDRVASAWLFSRVIFQVIVMGMLLLTSMISMKIFSRDQNDGTVQMFFSRPVNRWEYVMGRILGTWIFSSGFMLVLHLTILCIVFLNTRQLISGYLSASIVCCVNLLFVVSAVCLFSLFMPDFISAMAVVGIICTGFVSDGGYKLFSYGAVRMLAPAIADTAPAEWRIFFPKLFMVQAFGDSFISGKRGPRYI